MAFTDDEEFKELLKVEVLSHLKAGDKVKAAQVYCDTTGASLSEALAEVERIAASLETPGEGERGGVDEEEVLRLLGSEGKIAAVKYYRDQTGSGLADAKAAVEAIEARQGGSRAVIKKSGCLGVVLELACAVVSLFAKA